MGPVLFAFVRLIHLVCAVLWVGMAFAMSAFVFPAILKGRHLGFLRQLFLGTGYRFAFPVVSIVTTVAGITLFLLGAVGDFTKAGLVVLVLGACSGILAFLHGAITLGGLQSQLIERLRLFDSSDAVSSHDETRAVLIKDARHGIISFWLSTFALLFMGLARFIP